MFVAFSLVACASRPETGFLSAVAYAPPGAVDHTILVATTRERDDRPGTLFNGDRATTTDYAEITVSIPPNHKSGEIEWASTPPGDPNVDFVVHDEKYLDGDKAFVQALNAQLALRPPGSRNVFLFIHGFNTMFAEAVYRGAQLAHDSKAPGVPVLFTWASRGKATAYVYDLNSATAARDALEHTLRLLLASNAEEVNVLAHSMGNWVTVEAFRQIRISGDLAPRIRSAISISRRPISTSTYSSRNAPLRQAAKALLRHPVPGRSRVVSLQNHRRRRHAGRRQSRFDELASLGATVIDLTDLKATDATNHDKFAPSAPSRPSCAAFSRRASTKDHQASRRGPKGDKRRRLSGSLPLTILGAPMRIIAGQ